MSYLKVDGGGDGINDHPSISLIQNPSLLLTLTPMYSG